MLKNFLTGGIDLPKLATDLRVLQAQLFSTRGVPLGDPEDNTVYKSLADLPTRYGSLVERLDAIDDRAEETNAALADHIGKANELIASRALAEDVETLRMKLDRVDGDNITMSEELHDAVQKLAAIKANHDDIAAVRATVASLAATVSGLNAKVAAQTATKLSEMKVRKAPKK